MRLSSQLFDHVMANSKEFVELNINDAYSKQMKELFWDKLFVHND